ncbi:flagellin N-terminal helical domain-containing protein [Sphingomonas nostoxanthinifaciens]|uniref:flagellin N-terminal helical domain-containing protein n=1 Tax=Sphingomonas nostoxanthinifaciens TaxID=2872652 RepID=UPI001CC21262|nr:flagellin [Sphingomonas nostoxanthinifaciens]UAK26037.1 flagellin protein FlaA [Sphingomonas nostoxanthinifaciens]
MTVINTNISALIAQNGSNAASSDMQTAMQRLSTGKRINSAKDDAAGLAISSRMTSTVNGLAVAIRNANDGVSLAQTAEGALGQVTSMLQRMKELAVQSANGTLSDSDRSSLQNETSQLVSQINDIAKNTDFNGIKLLDGSNKTLTLQTGVTAGDTVSISTQSVKTSALGLTGANGVSTGRVTAGTYAASDLTINGVNALAASTVVASAKDLAAALNANSSATGITATAVNTVTTKAITGAVAASALTINGKGVAAAASATDLVNNINNNSSTYGGVTATLNSDNTITLANQDGANIDLTGSDSTNVVTSASSVSGYVTMTSNTDGYTTVGGTTSGLSNAKLNASNGVSFTGAAVTGSATAVTLSNITINGVDVSGATGVPASASAADTAAAIALKLNSYSAQTGVQATADATGKISLSSTNGGAVRVDGTGASGIGFNDQGGSDKIQQTLDISTQNAASNSLSIIDKALDKVSSQRGTLGAVENRLQVTVNNLTTTSNNLTDAKSRIEDADFSAETTNLAKAQILSQAANAMLAQANQSKQSVLSLLK